MKPNAEFQNRNSSFWAYVRLVSERLGYSKGGLIISHSKEKAIEKLTELRINIEEELLDDALKYINYRTDLLNSHSEKLMDAAEAKEMFTYFKKLHKAKGFSCKLPMNKQKGEKKDYAFFTGIVNIIAEGVIRDYAEKNDLEYGKDLSFDDDPKNLAFVLGKQRHLEGIMSRRFDGAFPSVQNAHLIWEIKEYYYTTTFGSRIADGVYETQLDGYEVKTIREETNVHIKHVYFIDAKHTWWIQGKSYLCRIVDMLHMGLVDEVIFGKEVAEEFPRILLEVLDDYKKTFIR